MGTPSCRPAAGDPADAGHPVAIRVVLTSDAPLTTCADPARLRGRVWDEETESLVLARAETAPRRARFRLLLDAGERPDPIRAAAMADAVRRHFRGRRAANALRFSRLLREGRDTLGVALLFLGVCLTLSRYAVEFAQPVAGPFLSRILAEGLTIAGWVAMWHPVEIILYRWWPVRRTGRLFARLANADIRIVAGDDAGP